MAELLEAFSYPAVKTNDGTEMVCQGLFWVTQGGKCVHAGVFVTVRRCLRGFGIAADGEGALGFVRFEDLKLLLDEIRSCLPKKSVILSNVGRLEAWLSFENKQISNNNFAGVLLLR